jgi:hypothetical protein
MELAYIDDFIYQILIAIHLLILMFGLVYFSGRLFSYFLNIVFFSTVSEEKRKFKKVKKMYDNF